MHTSGCFSPSSGGLFLLLLLLQDALTQPLRLGLGLGVSSSHNDDPFLTATASKRISLFEGDHTQLTAKARVELEPRSSKVGWLVARLRGGQLCVSCVLCALQCATAAVAALAVVQCVVPAADGGPVLLRRSKLAAATMSASACSLARGFWRVLASFRPSA